MHNAHSQTYKYIYTTNIHTQKHDTVCYLHKNTQTKHTHSHAYKHTSMAYKNIIYIITTYNQKYNIQIDIHNIYKSITHKHKYIHNAHLKYRNTQT